jgi:hypothetical protein
MEMTANKIEVSIGSALEYLDLVQVIGVASWGLLFVLPEPLMGRKIWRWE